LAKETSPAMLGRSSGEFSFWGASEPRRNCTTLGCWAGPPSCGVLRAGSFGLEESVEGVGEGRIGGRLGGMATAREVEGEVPGNVVGTRRGIREGRVKRLEGWLVADADALAGEGGVEEEQDSGLCHAEVRQCGQWTVL